MVFASPHETEKNRTLRNGNRPERSKFAAFHTPVLTPDVSAVRLICSRRETRDAQAVLGGPMALAKKRSSRADRIASAGRVHHRESQRLMEFAAVATGLRDNPSTRTRTRSMRSLGRTARWPPLRSFFVGRAFVPRRDEISVADPLNPEDYKSVVCIRTRRDAIGLHRS